MPGASGRIGSVRFRAWTWLFSSTHSTIARSGGFRYKPTTSRTFSTNCGSLENLKFSTRCGCNPKACPNSHDGILRQTCLFGHQPSAPVRTVGRHRFQRLCNNVLNLLIGDLARRPDPRLIQQPIQPPLSKPFPPFTNGRGRNMQLPRNLQVAHALPTTEHDPGTHCHRLRRLRPTCHHAQFLPIRIEDFQRFLGATCTHTQVYSVTPIYSRYLSLRTLDLLSRRLALRGTSSLTARLSCEAGAASFAISSPCSCLASIGFYRRFSASSPLCFPASSTRRTLSLHNRSTS